MAKFAGNKIDGTLRADVINGTATADKIEGKAGSDVLYGNAGNDVLDGGSGNDKLYGGTGNDLLDGGTGNDILTGGSGADLFEFGNLRSGADIITDFEQGIDKIVFDLDAVNSLRDISITSQADGDALISWAGGSIELQGVDAESLTASDFLF